jgi:hypothetical protein
MKIGDTISVDGNKPVIATEMLIYELKVKQSYGLIYPPIYRWSRMVLTEKIIKPKEEPLH